MGWLATSDKFNSLFPRDSSPWNNLNRKSGAEEPTKAVTSPVGPGVGSADAAKPVVDGSSVAVAGGVVAGADAAGEIGVAAVEEEEPHPAASTAESAKANRAPITVTRERGKRKRERSAESLIPVIPSALLEVCDTELVGRPLVIP